MKILMLTPYLPYPLVSGGQIRTYNLLKNLTSKHQITLFSLIKNQDDTQYVSNLKPYCNKINVFKRSSKPFTLKNILKAGLSRQPFLVTRNLVSETKSAVEAELASGNYDLIHAETFYMMPNIPKTSVPTILVEQTIESLGYQSYANNSRLWFLKPLLNLDIKKIEYWEQYYWQHADRLITMSQEDKSYIQSKVPGKAIDVVANGVDISYFNSVQKKPSRHPTVLFVGTFSWLPNVQAVKTLVKNVWPSIQQKLPQARLKIVGFQPTPEILAYANDPTIEVNGSVADIRDAYAGAQVLVAPVSWGKGTRYKILEAMATKTPIVATNIAVEGILGIKPGTHVLIGDTSESIATKTVRLLTDRALQKKLASASYDLVKAQYNWQVISKELDRVYQEIGSKS